MTESIALRAGIVTLALCAASGAMAQAIVPQPTPNADALAAQVRVLSSNPRDVNALVTAGELSSRLADTDAAMAFFARAEAVDPRNPRIAAGKASALVTMERPGEALRLYEQAERAGLAMTSYLAQRGLAYDLTGQPGYAQRDYRRALQAGSDDETVRRLALSLGMTGKREEAMALLDPLLRRSDRAAWRARAFIMALAGDMAGAERIATTTMPGGAALGPFFRRLPTLSPADRAFAVHFGELNTTAARIADARLAPPVAVLPAEPAPVAVAAATPAPATTARDRRRSRAQTSLRGAQVARRSAPAAGFSSSGTAKPVTDATRTALRAVAPVQVARAAPTPPVTVGVQPSQSAASRSASSTATVATPASSTSAGPARPVSSGADAVVASNVPPTAAARRSAPAAATPPQQQTAAVPRAAVSPPPATAVRPAPATAVTSARPTPAGTTATAPAAANAAAPRASVPYQVIDAPSRAAQPVATAAASPAAVRRRGNEALLASIIAGIEVPSSELEARTTPARTPAAPPAATRPVAVTATPRSVAKPAVTADKAATAVKPATKAAPLAKAQVAAKTDAKATAATKPADASRKPTPAKADTARWWVQVAGGARAADLDKDWKRLTDKSAALKGKSAYVTPLRATNRLLTGPFKTEAEARGVVNALAKEGKSAFTFQSSAGQKVDRLDAE